MIGAAALLATGLVVAAAAPATLDRQVAGRAQLLDALAASQLVDPNRQLVGVEFVCTLAVGRERFGVVDLREVIPKAGSPGGLNRVLLLDAAGRLTTSFEYGLARPIACRGESLILFGETDPRHDGNVGNVIVYGRNGRIAGVRAVDAAELWPTR